MSEEKTTPREPIEVVIKKRATDLMSLPGVVGLAQGKCGDQPCIKVYVKEDDEKIVKNIPRELDGYLVTIQKTGEIRPLAPE